MTAAPRPPRLAEWLLHLVVPRGAEGDTIRGDLREEFVRRSEGAGRSRSWYWRAVLSIALRYRAHASTLDGRGRGESWTVGFLQDVRYAGRTLIKAPSFTAVVLVTLALGIGANTAIFSALNAVLLRSLPYPHAEQLVRLVAFNPVLGISRSNVSAADFMDWRRDAKSFAAMGAFSTFSTTMRAEDGAERIAAARVDGVFDVLGAPFGAGRDFTGDEMRPGTPVAIVAHDLWLRRYAGNPDAVGRPLRPGVPTTLVGVTAKGFAYPEDTEFWVPLSLDRADPRDNRALEAIARLKPGVTATQAQAELDTISARLDAAYQVTNRGWRVRVVPLRDFVVGDAKLTLVLLLGGVSLVLLVACANVANLFVAHASARQRELAVRAALGARRARIVRQVLTESLLLSCAAGALGLVIGYWGMRLLAAIGANDIPRLAQVSLDQTVFLFSLGISLVTGIAFGLVPALSLSRSDLTHALREALPGSGTRTRTRRALVVAEVAVALVLLAAAALLGQSFRSLQLVDPGFDAKSALTMRVSLAGPKYRQAGASAAYFQEAATRLSATPGIRSAAAALSLPVGGGGFYLGRGFVRPGRAHPPEGYTSMYQIVTPGYFRALGTPLIHGRDFDAHDTAASRLVVIVNHAIAERQFAGENPIGQHVHVWRDETTPREIVGVVGDLRSENLAEPGPSEMYVPIAQSECDDMTFVIRTTGDPMATAGVAKTTLQGLDPTQAVYHVKSFDTIMRGVLARQRFSLMLFAAFAGLALLLAAVGLYGVMTHVVADRTREMGVRLALGARPDEVRRLVVRQGMSLFALGVGCGLMLSLAATQLLGNLLYGVRPFDPATLAVVTLVMGLVALVSTYVPARRATRVDPAAVLRTS